MRSAAIARSLSSTPSRHPRAARDVELFDLNRDYTKRGAPYHKVFSEVIAPAMLTTGASGEQITEILRKYINCALC